MSVFIDMESIYDLCELFPSQIEGIYKEIYKEGETGFSKKLEFQVEVDQS